jgi:hypothetical protein
MADAAPASSDGGAAAGGVDAEIKEMWQGEMDEMKAGEDEEDEFVLTVSLPRSFKDECVENSCILLYILHP